MKINNLFKSLSVGLLIIVAFPAFAGHKGSAESWLVRLRGTYVQTLEHGSKTSLSIGTGRVEIDDDVAPEININYFFTPNIATELSLGVSKHNVDAKTNSIKIGIGHVYFLPATLILQYHFHFHPKVQPYIGAGVNYTHFFNIHHATGISDVSYTDSFRPAVQVGTDIYLSKNWLFNIDVKKLYMRTKLKGRIVGVDAKTNVHIDPVVYGLGVGYRF